jgi:hypothetical protein
VRALVRFFWGPLIAGRFAIAKFESIERYSGQEQVSTEMKIVGLPFAVDNPDRLEVQVLEFVEPAQLGRLSIETLRLMMS